MRVNVKADGLDAAIDRVRQFSDRRMDAAVATALTRTAKSLAQGWTKQISGLDRPVARTQSAASFTGANAANLSATVFLKDRMTGGVPADYLAPQEHGGGRLVKKFERALISSGAMPAGYVTVPGKGAELDGNGNVRRAQIVAVIAQLGSSYSPGYERVISKSTEKRLARQAKHGRSYVAYGPDVARRAHVNPGIYERLADGSRRAVFLFKRGVTYRARISLMERARADAESILRAEMTRSVAESAARLAARG